MQSKIKKQKKSENLLTAVSSFVCGGYQVIIAGLFWIILSVLTLLAAISTSKLQYYWEYSSFYLKDSVSWNLAFACLITAILIFLKKLSTVQRFLNRIEEDSNVFYRYRKILLGVLFVIATVWALSTQIKPFFDQLDIMISARLISQKDYSRFLPGQYLEMFPNQLGLTLLFLLFSKVFGYHNFVAFQLLNVLGLILFYDSLTKICDLLHFKRTVQLGILIYGVLFFPLIMYTSFVYGTILGLALSIFAIRYEILFFQQQKWRYVLLSAASIALAIMIKSNYSIFMIGIFISACIEIFREKKALLLIFPAAVLIFSALQSNLTMGVSRHISGQPLDQGLSAWSWIAMGLQDNGQNYPGWFNGYNISSYNESNFQKSVQKDMVQENIKETLKGWKENPNQAVSFFLRKTASQWNNPNFESFWIAQGHEYNITLTNKMQRFMSINGSDFFGHFLNILQFLTLTGALFYLVLYWKEPDYRMSLIFGLIFIGGFTFHLFWEAKCQYTLTYFVLLFPYTIAGYDRLSDVLAAAFSEIKSKRKISLLSALKTIPLYSYCFVIVFMLSLGTMIALKDGDFSEITSDDEIYQAYAAEHSFPN